MIYLFKALLIVSILIIGYLALFHIQIKLIQRVLAVLAGAILSIFILVPEGATRVANWFGIGRGADFIFYLLHMFSAYLIVILYRRQQRSQDELTRIVRSLALQPDDIPKK